MLHNELTMTISHGHLKLWSTKLSKTMSKLAYHHVAQLQVVNGDGSQASWLAARPLSHDNETCSRKDE